MTPDLPALVIYSLSWFALGVIVGRYVIPWLYDLAQAILGPRER